MGKKKVKERGWMVAYDCNHNTFETCTQEGQFKLILVYLQSGFGGQPAPHETLSERGGLRERGKEKDTGGWGAAHTF